MCKQGNNVKAFSIMTIWWYNWYRFYYNSEPNNKYLSSSMSHISVKGAKEPIDQYNDKLK